MAKNTDWEFDTKKHSILMNGKSGSGQYSLIDLKFKRIKDILTGKYSYKIEFNAMPKGTATAIEGDITCPILGLDSTLMDMREYGIFLNRADITAIQSLVDANFVYFEEEVNDVTAEYESIICLFFDDYFEKSSYEIPVSAVNNICKQESIDKTLFIKWLISNNFIEATSQNKGNKSNSQLYTKVVKENGKNSTKRVYMFNEAKVTETLEKNGLKEGSQSNA